MINYFYSFFNFTICNDFLLKKKGNNVLVWLKKPILPLVINIYFINQLCTISQFYHKSRKKYMDIRSQPMLPRVSFSEAYRAISDQGWTRSAILNVFNIHNSTNLSWMK